MQASANAALIADNHHSPLGWPSSPRMSMYCRVKIRSKGPDRKGNPPLRDIDLSLDIIFFNNSYIVYKGISFHRNNLRGPLKNEAKDFPTS